jgi:hypothetical protein
MQHSQVCNRIPRAGQRSNFKFGHPWNHACKFTGSARSAPSAAAWGAAMVSKAAVSSSTRAPPPTTVLRTSTTPAHACGTSGVGGGGQVHAAGSGSGPVGLGPSLIRVRRATFGLCAKGYGTYNVVNLFKSSNRPLLRTSVNRLEPKYLVVHRPQQGGTKQL